MTEGLYYQPSGKFSLLAVPAGLFTGLAVGLPGAFIYAYVALYSHYIPFVRWGTFLLAAVFGFFVGASTSGGLRWGKARNAAVGHITALVVGLAALYVSWAVWIYAVLRRVDAKPTLLPLLGYPPLLWHFIVEVSKVGAWTLLVTPTGIVLWILWGIEAVIILGAAVFVGAAGLDDPFCESCKSWCDEMKGFFVVNAGEPREVKERMERKDFGYLEKLGSRALDAPAWLRVDMHRCPSPCGQTSTLSLTLVSVSVDKEGKRSETTKSIVENLLVSSSEVGALIQVGAKISRDFLKSAIGISLPSGPPTPQT